MSILTDGQTTQAEPNDIVAQRKSSLRAWLFSYEIYIIVIIASFLRLYGLQTTEFDGDQADIFRMAHDAVIHGHLVATSNIASIGIYNPPGIIYALMIPAAVSANPLGGAIETAILSILGVLITYWFTYRYYGRIIAAIATSLFAVCTTPLFYSRFMWNQNLLLFFVPLFIAVLFRGAVDRKRGWLFPAIFLYGLMFQWHGSALLLAAPLLVAWLLVPKTVRWRDIILGILSVLILYSPYFVWQISTHFAILSLLFHSPLSSYPVVINSESWHLYLHFLDPYDQPLGSVSLLYHWQRFFNWLFPAMKYLIIGASLFVLLLALSLRLRRTKLADASIAVSRWGRVRHWLRDLRESPYRCGLLILLAWEVFPILYNVRHQLTLFPHYFIILMPVPFILIGILLVKTAQWVYAQKGWYRFISPVIYLFAGVLILFQGIAGTVSVFESVDGNFVDKQLSTPYYNSLDTLQNVLKTSDQLAQQYHAKRVIVEGDQATRIAFRYLSPDLIQTPSTVVDSSCLLLPSPSAGPAVILVPPYQPVLDSFISSKYMHVFRFAETTHLGGSPFHLYVVNPLPQAIGSVKLASNIQFVNMQTELLQDQPYQVSRWNMLQAVPTGDRTQYSYKFTFTDKATETQLSQVICTMTNVHVGDQMLTVLPLPQKSRQSTLSPQSVQVEYSVSIPHMITLKRLGLSGVVFDTFQQDASPWSLLKTRSSESLMTIPVTSS